MALTKVTYSMIEGPFLNVNDFGTGASAVTAAMQTAIVNDQIVLFSEDTTINIPTDCATLQLALDHANCIQGKTITLNIESGHELTAGISISNGDYSRFLITSEDAEVNVAASVSATQLFVMNSIFAPQFDILVVGNGTNEECYRYINSIGAINPGAGAKSFAGRALYANASNISAGQTVWEDNEEIFISNGSAINISESSITNHSLAGITLAEGSSGGIGASTITGGGIGIHLKDEAMLDAEDVTITGTTDEAVRVDSASITLDSANLLLCKERGINILNGRVQAPSVTITGDNTNFEAIINRGGQCDAGNCTISDFGNGYSGLTGSSGNIGGGTLTGKGVGTGVGVSFGATCSCANATITGFTAGRDLSITTGSYISANGATTSNSVSPGVPNVTDTVVAAFNTITTNRGIIWN